MISKLIPDNEEERLQNLYDYDILDSLPEKDYDDIVALASFICQTPISAISFIDKDREWQKANVGLQGNTSKREDSFCAYAILDSQPLIVNDALNDEHFCNHPAVLGSIKVRFYAGVPITTPQGFNLGMLCVVDSVPRELKPEQLDALKKLGNQVCNLLELRLKNKKLSTNIDELSKKNTKIQQLSDIQAKLLYIISHDLKSPLATLQNLLNLLAREDLTQEEVMLITKDLQLSVSNASFLLSNLLEWGVNQMRQGNLPLSTFNVHHVVKQVIELFELIAKKKKVEIINLVEEQVHITANEGALSLIIRNLVQNALKFTSNGSVTVSMQEENYGNIFIIQDTGVGMSEEVKNKLFNWENRVKKEGTAKEKGSGLGLLMCRDFITQMGGEIWIESELGRGTKISFSLPKR
jgi:signal transduction histidine kinase